MAAESQEDTVFHKIMRKELPATFVHEDDTCFVIKDLNPVAPIHYLIIPRKTIKNLAKAEPGDEAILGHLLYVASKLAKQENLDDDGYRVVINTNHHAWQTVFQLHVHLVGDNGQINCHPFNIQMKPSLKFFLLHSESKRLFKRFMLITKGIEDIKQRKELREWIRHDFKMNKHLIDDRDIKLQHVRARMALEELETSIHLSRAKSGNTGNASS